MGVTCEALQLAGDGLWGIFYLREMKGAQLFLWTLLATWTVASAILLVGEMSE